MFVRTEATEDLQLANGESQLQEIPKSQCPGIFLYQITTELNFEHLYLALSSAEGVVAPEAADAPDTGREP